MTIAGTAYGVILNDRSERERLATAFRGKPYQTPPSAPVVYVKPRRCIVTGPGIVVASEGDRLEAAATVGLLFGRDSARTHADDAWAAVAAVCLAVDLSVPQDDYYRPAIAQRCRDGFLPLGDFVAPAMPDEVVTSVDGVECHRWSLDRMVRTAAELVSDLSAFMTLRAGDLLLVGLPGDAPRIRPGQTVSVSGGSLPGVDVMIAGRRP